MSGEGVEEGAATHDCGRERGEKAGEVVPVDGWIGN